MLWEFKKNLLIFSCPYYYIQTQTIGQGEILSLYFSVSHKPCLFRERIVLFYDSNLPNSLAEDNRLMLFVLHLNLFCCLQVQNSVAFEQLHIIINHMRVSCSLTFGDDITPIVLLFDLRIYRKLFCPCE